MPSTTLLQTHLILLQGLTGETATGYARGYADVRGLLDAAFTAPTLESGVIPWPYQPTFSYDRTVVFHFVAVTQQKARSAFTYYACTLLKSRIKYISAREIDVYLPYLQSTTGRDHPF